MKMDFEVPSQLGKARLSRQSKDHHSLFWRTKPKIFWLQIVKAQVTEKSFILEKKNKRHNFGTIQSNIRYADAALF